jgi:hypothetical protein
MSRVVKWLGAQWNWAKVEIATERKRFLGYLVVAAAVVALVVLRQISAMLGRIEIGHASSSMSVLTGPHWGWTTLDEAGRLWGQPGKSGHDLDVTRDQIAGLIQAHVWVDFALIALYGLMLWQLLQSTVPTTNGSLPSWAPRIVWLTVLSDAVENLLLLVFAERVAQGDPPSTVLDFGLMVATWAKWIFLALVLLSALRHAWLRWKWGPKPVPVHGRVWRRHRVQLGTVIVFALLVAVPGAGPLDQLPDVLRTLADGSGVRWGELFSSFATLAIFCLALEVAGRWALLDDKANVSRSVAPRPVTLCVFGALLLLAAGAMALWWRIGGFDFNAGILAAPIVLLVLSVAPRVLGLTFLKPDGPPQEQVDVPDALFRPRVRRAGRLLAAIPVAIAGLGLVRAFADPVLAGPKTATGESWTYLVVGIVTVLFIAPAFYLALGLLERLLLRESSATGPVRTTPVHWVGVSVFVAAWTLALLAAADPVTFGPQLNATGSMTVFFALVAVTGGLLQRLVELQMPYAVTRALGFGNRSPVFVTLAVVFVVAGLLNTQGGYHAVRLTGDSPQQEAGWTLDGGFDQWLQQVRTCTLAGHHAVAGHDTVPLVLVAAPGGGIRAAYWTEHALDEVEVPGSATDAGCAGRRVFAASGVSGGSVGLVTHYTEEDGDPISSMSGEKPLAASMAAMFFRDLPAGMLGVSSGWPDRAAALEDAWIDADGPLGRTRLVRDLAPGNDGNGGWRPLLLLNGTEVSTGCRVVVSAVDVVATSGGGAPSSCKGSAVATSGDGFVHGAVDFLSFPDALTCDDEPVTDRDVNAATAGLLSARFPYVSPSAELFDCVPPGKPTADQPAPVRAADLDGGGAENSGLATILDLWSALEPTVAAHNADVLAQGAGEDGVLVVPFLVVVDNHYATSVLPGPVDRQRELSAPTNLLSAKGTLSEQAVLEQRAQLAFSGTAPGLEGTNASVRFFRLAPTTRPGVAAPLGWTLSDMTRDELTAQLDTALRTKCSDAVAGAPRPVRCFLDAIGVPAPDEDED